MNTEKILKSDLLDILFEKRNKNYGAYILRKFYPNRIKTSLLIMLSIVVLFSAFTFLPDNKMDNSNKPMISDSILVKQMKLNDKIEKPDLPKQQMANQSQQKLISKIQIVPNEDTVDVLKAINNLAIGNETINAPEGPGTGKPGLSNGGPETTPQIPAEPVAVKEGPELNPDMQPFFPGGDKELIKFLQKNLRSPRDMEEGETVEVKIKYVVGFDGNLQSFSVVKDGGEMFNDEVIRVLKKMPKWNPGKKGGQNVPVYYTIPVKFTSAE